MIINDPRAPIDGSPAPAALTDAEKLAAIETYIKTLTPIAQALRAKVTADMGALRTEKVGAYLPDGVKLASVSRSDGRRSGKVTDEDAALAWCLKVHPEQVQTVQVIRPAYLKMLCDLAKADDAKAGALGVDPETGEELPFIRVEQGNPYVSVLTTDEGVVRMTALAHGFAGMLEAKP